ncbi:MAG TPA: 6,7-dimethyl-8-ribityllumazine synthase [Candidatus Saccharimonadales bacterium]|nr:6,7-dimethyl-8-ribityllumazine synthase [Candidatus Saccharimonadales bacterium]
MVSIGIVRSEFNEEITSKMLERARRHAKKLGMKIVAEATVPGAFDIPIAVKKMLERKDVDGVATLGAVIKGSTKHDELISYTLANYITKLSLKYGKPVGLGVMGPGITWKQAKARISQYSEQSVEAVLKLHGALKGI